MHAESPARRFACGCIVATLAFSLCFGCDKGNVDIAQISAGGSSPSKLNVIATTSILGDWARIVGGEQVNVKVLVGPDGDPHEYEPVPSDNIAMTASGVVIENGLGLESWLDKLYASSQSKALRVVATDGVTARRVPVTNTASSSSTDDDRDPHAWQDVSNAQVMVSNIRDGFAKADPAHAAAYQSRADDYLQQLDQLDKWVNEQIQSLAPARRTLVTSHDAFGYFGRRYGMDVTRSALESVTSEASDPSAKQIADVVRSIKLTGVPVIFLENVQNRKLIDQIASDAQVRVAPALYSDALGKPGTAGDTYLKMIRYNVNTMVKALAE